MPPATRRPPERLVLLDRALERLPLFRLSDSAEDAPVSFSTETGGRWRVLAPPDERLPGTFDQDVYVELMRRFHEAGSPDDGTVSFTLHSFLRAIGRRADGRTYEQLRAALTRLERTVLESVGAYTIGASRPGAPDELRFTLLTGVAIQRRRLSERDQLSLFPALSAAEPGDARVTIAPALRRNLAAGHTTSLYASRYFALDSPVARRLYRLLEVARAERRFTWRVPLDRLRELIPLVQRYPSHLQRVLQPAHEMLIADGVLRSAEVTSGEAGWSVEYVLAPRRGAPSD